MNSNWWEISLGSEQEQELRGRLQFRRSSRSASESENVCYEEETIAKSNDDSKDEGTINFIHKSCGKIVYFVHRPFDRFAFGKTGEGKSTLVLNL